MARCFLDQGRALAELQLQPIGMREWKDHGHAQVFASYESLLQKYYPAGADMWMPTMNYGQYFHFMSGAAGVDLVPLAREAFAWHADFDDEIAAAKTDFPDIKY
jgi:hypothetical protein